MFAIYDTNGLYFRDTLEKLRQLQPVTVATKSQLRSNTTDSEPSDERHHVTAKLPDDVVSSKAEQAYKEMLHLNKREPIVHAYQLMSSPVSTISMDMDILDARQIFQKQKFQQMPVVNSMQRLVGILSVQDLLQFIMMDEERIVYVQGKRVSDAMSSGVITADPVSDIRRVARLMQEYKLNGVPIVDQHDTLLGIVSRSDILLAVTNDPPLNMWS